MTFLILICHQYIEWRGIHKNAITRNLHKMFFISTFKKSHNPLINENHAKIILYFNVLFGASVHIRTIFPRFGFCLG